MSKITALEAKTYQGKPSGFKVTFDNGKTGNLQEKESDKGLRVGDEVIVTEIPYTSKAGVASILYGVKLGQQSAVQTEYNTPPPTTQPPQRPTIHVGAGKSVNELKADASIQILLKVLSAFYDGKLESAQISVVLKDYDHLVWSEIDEIFSGK